MIAERLRTLRKEQNLSKRQLVSRIPINYSTYANYESGFREPNSEILQVLASHFDVSLDFLLGVSDNRQKADEIAVLTEDEHEHMMHYRRLDDHGRELLTLVLSKEIQRINKLEQEQEEERKDWVALRVFGQRASAGLGNYLSEDSDDDFDTMRFMKTPISKRADFCVRIKGESMEPKICDGDIVFVKTVPRVEFDDVGIFVYEGEAYCKKLKIDRSRGEIYLESINEYYKPLLVKNLNQIRTIGLVLGVAKG